MKQILMVWAIVLGLFKRQILALKKSLVTVYKWSLVTVDQGKEHQYSLSWLRHSFAAQKGEVNIAGVMMMGISMVFIAVGFIIYPIILTAVDSILTWTAADTLVNLPGYAAGPPVVPADISIFTGLSQVAGIVPLLVLVGFLAAAVIQGLMGLKLMRDQVGDSKMDMGGILLLGVGLIFISVGLIIFPVIMDGVSVAYNTALGGTYTGMGIMPVAPLLVLIAFVAAAVVSGFFGVKMQMAKAAG